MRLPRVRFTVGRMTALVAFGAWVAFNARLIWELLRIKLEWLPGPSESDIAVFAGLSFVVCSASAAVILALAVRGGQDRSGLWRFVISLVASMTAGFLAWGLAMLLYQAVCGTSLLSASPTLALPTLGAIVHLPFGIVVGILWGSFAKHGVEGEPVTPPGSGDYRETPLPRLTCENPLKIDYEIALGDCRAFHSNNLENRFKRRAWALVIGLGTMCGLVASICVYVISQRIDAALFLGAAMAVFSWAIGVRTFRQLPERFARKAMAADLAGTLFGWHTMELTPEGITVAAESGSFEHTWHAIEKAVLDRSHLFLYISPTMAHVVRHEFVTGEFLEELKSRLPADRLRGSSWELVPAQSFGLRE